MRINALRTLSIGLLSLAGAGLAHAECSTKDRSDQVAIVLCSAGADKPVLKAAGIEACKERQVCNAWIWTDAKKMPARAPVVDKDLPKSASGAARAIWINDSQTLIELRKAN